MSIRNPFEVMSGAALLARIPLMPAAPYPGTPGDCPLVAEGMFLASRHADPAPAGGHRRHGGRRAATARAYELRARFRPTPHGAFAGTAVAEAGSSEAELFLGTGHRARTYPHPAWLAAFADLALDSPGVLETATLTTSNLAVCRGERLEREQEAVPGVAGPQLVSVRATEAALKILELCRHGASYGPVSSGIAGAWPQVPEPLVRGMVLALVRAGFLVTDLVPGMDGQDPLGHMIARFPEESSLRRPVEQLRAHLDDADRCPPGAPGRAVSLAAARDACDDLAVVPRPLSADVAADARIVIPRALAREAAEAAGILWRMSQAGDPLAGFHRRFLDRYGPDRFVPLAEAAGPLTGLGDHLGDEEDDDRPGALRPGRVAVLAGLIAEAAASGRTEIKISDATVDALDRHPADLPPPPTAEVYARVLAEPVDPGGRLSLAVCGGGTQQAGSTAGRLTALLPGAAGAIAVPFGSALLAEIVVRPRTPELAGVAPPAGSGWPRIPVGVPARPGDLDLPGLLLASVAGRLILWSAGRDRPVMPVLLSRIGPRYMPPAARLLAGLAAHGCRPWHGWSWEPLHHSPFQPRIRYKRTILSPARWRLPDELTSAARDRSRWDQALTEWRSAMVPRPPDVVAADDADRQLPLDLRRETDRDLLRRYAGRGVTAVTELPGGHETAGAVVQGPHGRHVLELVIPLVRRPAAAPPEPPLPSQVRPRPLGHGLHLPGGGWLSAVIPAPPSCHEEILRSLSGFAESAAGRFNLWFWLRYRTDAHGPHLRARFHGDPVVLGSQVLPALSRWCEDLITRRLATGLVIEPYDRETERYGGGQAISLAEAVFGADSRLALAALAHVPDDDTRIIIAALSAAAIARTLGDGARSALDAGGLDRPGRRRAAGLRPLARKAADAGPAALVPPLPDEWADRDSALRAYRSALNEARRPDCASSLIHMHANRLLGDTGSERLARALAADILARKDPR